MANTLFCLRQLESLKFEFGPPAAGQKKACLQLLKRAELKNANQILRLHEVLCFMQAWPDDEEILTSVEAMLAHFERRRDLRQHADEMVNSGIAGTFIHFSFYAGMAKWLAAGWPTQIQIDWEVFEKTASLERYLSQLASYAETAGLESLDLELPAWINRLKGPGETDAVFIIQRLAALIRNEFLHEQFYDELDIPLILAPGPGVPNRTRAKYDPSPVVCQTMPLMRARPVVEQEIYRPMARPQLVSRAEGVRLVDLARAAMVTRQRDLDAFAYADVHDVSLLDDDGLQFVLYGVVPQRRFLLECLYGFLVLKNGVPISYGAITSLFGSAEVAYTIFDTFRGGESARIFVRVLAMVHQVFGCDTIMIDPYQLGAENQDALKSGAWWFYQKLGFRPRDKKLLQLMKRELSRMKRRPRHRSSLAVLKQLASENVYLNLNQDRDDVLGVLELDQVGLKITDLLAGRFGADREQGEKVLSAEAAERLGGADFQDWSAGEKLAWRRWAPLVALLDDVLRWPVNDRKAVVQLIRAKGARQELDYLHRFDGLPRLRQAVWKIATN
ncbi:MAG: hypothetical protein GTO53_07485 [Planctomycetales bacterium]|nr:hypothetical protein [Planctomycetales bacterium]NIN08441.1 hypothetical protein [Planctomycetales bacterium]NIN77575.1 hypothetical protein [Planctomycetales bacterium]NIO34740.1 hypothetical protein [Planctomycetales bacterium]NIO46543.1 hypothetical protein [Planctomycetales bacterium]